MGHDLELCLGDAGGTALVTATIPDGAACGITSVAVRVGSDGHGAIAVKAKGAPLVLPALPLSPPVTVRLRSTSSGACCATIVPAAGVHRNDGTRFRGRP